jgi:hypothetical protein
MKIIEKASPKKKLTMPKFNIGDIVCMKDDFSFNPCYKTMSIGKIEAIHMQVGNEFGARFNRRLNSYVSKSCFGRILYSISGFSLMPDEDKIELFTKKHLKIMASWKNLSDEQFTKIRLKGK